MASDPRTPVHLILVRILLALLIHTLLVLPAQAQTGAFSDSTILRRLRLYAPAILTADTSRLDASERRALGQIVAAGRAAERIYLLQAWAGNPTLLDSLTSDSSESGKLRLRYFMVNMSPWSAADRSSAFLAGVPEKRPPQANLYPEGMRRSEWGPWFVRLDARRQAEALGPWHVVRRDSSGTLKTVPYSEEYRGLLREAAVGLNAAAALSLNAGTRQSLAALVEAFEKNDYRESDRAAVAADGPISAVIGPTNGSLDGIFNYKRAFDAVIGVRNEAATRQVRLMETSLRGSEKNRPATAAASAGAPTRSFALRIDDAVFIGGGARAGSVASTVRLPEDSSATITSGGKVILLRNVHERKFTLIQAPIAAAAFDSATAAAVTFQAFFLTLMMHELRHRYDQGSPASQSPESDPANNLIDVRPALLEIAADLTAIAALERMAAQGQFPDITSRGILTTHVSTLLRALRFWATDPVTAGSAIQFNYLVEQGALGPDPSGGVLRIDIGKMKEGLDRLSTLTGAALADGNGRTAHSFYEKYAQQPAELTRLRERFTDIPYDLEPSFPLFHGPAN